MIVLHSVEMCVFEHLCLDDRYAEERSAQTARLQESPLLSSFDVCTGKVNGEAAGLRAALPRRTVHLCDLDSLVSRRCVSGQKQRHWLLGTSASLHLLHESTSDQWSRYQSFADVCVNTWVVVK